MHPLAEGNGRFKKEESITMRITVTLLLVICLVSPVAAMMSTTPDGSFQAIAQGPDTIALYWRHNGGAAQVFSNGRAVGTLQPTAGSTFSSLTISSLSPNTSYTFALGETGPAVTEKTWSCVPSQANYDVLVLGGTASGVAAAITGSRLGLRVALVESTNRLGGMSSNGLGSVDLRNPLHSNGMFEEFRRNVADFYGDGNGLKFEPRVANAIIKSMVYEQPNVTVFLKTNVVGAVVSDSRVLGAQVCDKVTGRRGRLLACVTIDATDTADFSASAGAAWRYGREARSDREPHAGVIYFDDKTQAILPGTTGAADSKTQSYGYLMIWKDYGEAGAPLIEKPRYYDDQPYKYSPPWDKTWAVSSGRLMNDKFEINQHPFGGDWPGINYDYPIKPQCRAEIDQMYRDRALGYLYYMQNELGHKNLGLADDEFVDNGNFPVDLYIREARRVMGEHVLTEDEVTNARSYHRANSIGIGDYPMDSHAMEDLKDPKRLDKGEGEMWLAKFTPWYQIPYGVILPCKTEGLLVTTAVSASHVAYGTLRLEPVRMSMGQVAATAAYYSISRSMRLRDINPAWIQDRILSQDAYITWNSDVTPATRHFKAINFIGARGVFPDEAFRPEENLTEAEAAQALTTIAQLEGGQPATITASTNPITRGTFATWLVETKMRTDATWQPVSCSQSYADVAPTDKAFAAVETLRAHRITPQLFADYTPGEFKPNAPITRADAAEAIYLAHRDVAMNYWRP